MVINAVTLHGSRTSRTLIIHELVIMIMIMISNALYIWGFSEFYCIYMTGSCTLLN